MIDITQLIPTVTKRLKAMPEGHWIELRTYKRNRTVRITKKGEDEFLVAEDGFYAGEFTSGISGMRRLMKTLVGREFPRSNKVRLYSGGPGESVGPLKKL